MVTPPGFTEKYVVVLDVVVEHEALRNETYVRIVRQRTELVIGILIHGFARLHQPQKGPPNERLWNVVAPGFVCYDQSAEIAISAIFHECPPFAKQGIICIISQDWYGTKSVIPSC